MTETLSQRYGVRRQQSVERDIDLNLEELRRLGFTVLDSGFDKAKVDSLKSDFDKAVADYQALFGFEELKRVDEHNGVRQLLRFSDSFADVALNSRLMDVVVEMLDRNLVLNQQNGVINPVGQGYNQDKWHRDLPYQHFTSSMPLAINAIYCVDDFTLDNGATAVIPGSHLQSEFPSEEYISKHQVQVEAKAGSYIVLDCMLFHRGCLNVSQKARRGVNQVFSTPIILQQIAFDKTLVSRLDLSEESANYVVPEVGASMDVETFLARRHPVDVQ